MPSRQLNASLAIIGLLLYILSECDGSRGVFQLGQVTADDYFGGT